MHLARCIGTRLTDDVSAPDWELHCSRLAVSFLAKTLKLRRGFGLCASVYFERAFSQLKLEAIG